MALGTPMASKAADRETNRVQRGLGRASAYSELEYGYED
jgi:hypothetical protein